jgi:hypothetical protein
LRHNRPLGMPDSTFDGLIAALRGAGLPEPSGEEEPKVVVNVSAVEWANLLSEAWDRGWNDAMDYASVGYDGPDDPPNPYGEVSRQEATP